MTPAQVDADDERHSRSPLPPPEPTDGGVRPDPARAVRAPGGPARRGPPAAGRSGAGSGGPGAPPPPPAAGKSRIPLDEVETIAYERAATLAGRYLGQPNVDTTGPAATTDKSQAASRRQARTTQAKDKRKEKEAGEAAGGDDLAAPPPGTAAVVKIPKVEPKPNGVRDLHLACPASAKSRSSRS